MTGIDLQHQKTTYSGVRSPHALCRGGLALSPDDSVYTMAGGSETLWGPLPIFGLHVFATGWPEISPRGQRQGFCLLFCSLGQWFSHFCVTKVQLGCFLKCLSLLPQRCWVGSPGLQVQWTSRWFWADATVSTL